MISTGSRVRGSFKGKSFTGVVYAMKSYPTNPTVTYFVTLDAYMDIEGQPRSTLAVTLSNPDTTIELDRAEKTAVQTMAAPSKAAGTIMGNDEFGEYKHNNSWYPALSSERFGEQMNVFDRMRETNREFAKLGGLKIVLDANIPQDEVHFYLDGMVVGRITNVGA